MIDRPFVRRFIVAVAMVSVTCATLATAAVLMRPPRFTTRVQAIGFVLNQHNIAYEKIYIDQSWPDSVNTIAFGANLLVIVRGGGRVNGRIDCLDGDRTCIIHLEKLGIQRVTIPDVAEPSANPLVAWIEASYRSLRSGQWQWGS